MSFQKYAEYKKSGVEWLGEIPVGWTTQKLKFVARVQPSNVDKKSKKDEKEVLLCNYTDVYYNEEITADLPFMKATASDVQIRKFTLKNGDTIITKDSEDPNDIAVPAYVPQDLDGVVCGYHLALLRPGKGTCGGYLKRVMDTQYARSVFATRANGITRYGLGTYAISNFTLPFPSLEEQKRIAAFLDKETTKIDTLIDKQEQLITLLQEKRQAIITHAVTRGLNPNVKMKDSGIEWLGEVPEYWEVSLLKRRYQVTLGKMLKSKQTSPDETEDPYLRAANIHWQGVDTTDVKRMWFTPEEKKKLKLYRDDLLVSEGGDVGRSSLWNEEIEDCYIQNSINRIRAREDADTRFLFYWMYFIKHADYIDMTCNKATIAHFTVEKVEATPCVYPPLEEQKRIIAFLEKETAKIDTLIEKCETAIELLKERRTALISAAVTGKIDVRSAV